MYDNNAVRVLLFEEGDAWVAQCVEFDIGAQGATAEEASRRMSAVLNLEGQESLFRTGKLFGGVPAAPREFSEIWESRSAPVDLGGPVQTDGTSIQVSYAEAA